MSGIGPWEGLGNEKTGEMVVYCDAESHRLQPGVWEQTFTRRADMDDRWTADVWYYVGGEGTDLLETGTPRTPRRGGPTQYIDAAGRVVHVWDSGRGIGDPAGAKRVVDSIDAARAVAGIAEGEHLPLRVRHTLRCPLCGDEVRRNDAKLRRHLNHLWDQDITRISLSGLRALDSLLS